jgi:hypothetical protein
LQNLPNYSDVRGNKTDQRAEILTPKVGFSSNRKGLTNVLRWIEEETYGRNKIQIPEIVNS